jgi:hypothetical protein
VGTVPLGEKLWEEKSRSLGTRITDVSERGIQEEVSFSGEVRGFGRLEGITGRIVGTDEHSGRLSEGVISGTAVGALTLGDDMMAFRAVGLGKLTKKSPLGAEMLVSLIHFPDPPPNLSWMRTTLIIWEAVVDAKNQTITATAYEWK